jgi:ArsR family transcriptional regulator
MNDRLLVQVLKALGDSTRFRIVQALAKVDELHCNQVVDRFELSQPTISHHLKVLTDAGLVDVRVDGKHRFLSLNRAVLEALEESLPIQTARKPRRAGIR